MRREALVQELAEAGGAGQDVLEDGGDDLGPDLDAEVPDGDDEPRDLDDEIPDAEGSFGFGRGEDGLSGMTSSVEEASEEEDDDDTTQGPGGGGGGDEDEEAEGGGRMLDEEDLLAAGDEDDMGMGMGMDMDADLDDDIPEAGELSGVYEQTDVNRSSSSDDGRGGASSDEEEDDGDISFAPRVAAPLRAPLSPTRERGPRSSMDLSGLLSADSSMMDSSMLHSSPNVRAQRR
uniref:Replicase polyprotein 1a n=1 Tax=Colletotrichum fructicola (strain Nara gc5) TaxID=1213859 RepID=L2FQQ2_COLFN